MGIFDKAKELGDRAKDAVAENADKINEAAQKAGDFIDEKTDGKYADKVDKAQDFIKDKTEDGSSGTPTA